MGGVFLWFCQPWGLAVFRMAHRGAERLRVARLCGGVLRRVRDRVAHDRVDEPWLLWASGAEAIA